MTTAKAGKVRAAAGSSPQGSDKGKKRKKSNLRYYIGIPAVLIAGVVAFGLMPITGTMKYGICRTFIEKRYTYPIYMDIISVLERETDVRIEYTVVNEFGDTMFHTITCVYRPDPVSTMALASVVLDRQKIEQAELDTFNRTIPAVLAYPPDLKVPMPMTEDLMNLWRQQR
ncbi:MAG: hypothetical protein HYU57_00960 [Micavibrio aeruginosavorus]|nr:hypothetical protein [Micavibrio aeruginosavorus]